MVCAIDTAPLAVATVRAPIDMRSLRVAMASRAVGKCRAAIDDRPLRRRAADRAGGRVLRTLVVGDDRSRRFKRRPARP